MARFKIEVKIASGVIASKVAMLLTSIITLITASPKTSPLDIVLARAVT